MLTVREDLGSIYTTADKFDDMMERQFYLNFTSARGSEQEFIYSPFPYDNVSDYTTLNDPLTPFSHWKIKKAGMAGSLVNADGTRYDNFGGRQKTCKSAGLTGAEKRACAKKLRAMGWKKGQPVPQDISPSEKEIQDAQKELEAQKQQQQGEGLSTGAKIGIAVGAFAVLATGLYFAFKGGKKSAPPVTAGAQ